MTTKAQAEKAVKRAAGNKSEAARALGLTRNQLRYALGEAGAARKGAAKLTPEQAKIAGLEKALADERARKVATLPKPRKAKPSPSIVRVVIPDSHGEHVDRAAATAMIRDIAQLSPDEIVWIGDHLDCGGVFSAHQRSYTKELTESYEADVDGANWLLDSVMQAAPSAQHHYLEGNHEHHVERWAARNFPSYKDAKFALRVFGPEAQLRLRERGIPYYRMSESHMGLTTPGMIRLGKCHYSHGWLAGKHATASMLAEVGGNLVHGHTHRAGAAYSGTTTSFLHGAWGIGTLAKRQMLYMHTKPSNWTIGYIVQFANRGTGTFVTFQVPIFGDKTLLLDTVNAVAGRAA